VQSSESRHFQLNRGQFLNALSAEVADQPKLAEVVRTFQRINDKDAEVMRLFRLEIAKSKQLIALRPSQQRSFYLQQIIPLHQEATSASDEEIGMMRDAEKAGVVLPSDLQELIKPNH
jgi:hypothetical protein